MPQQFCSLLLIYIFMNLPDLIIMLFISVLLFNIHYSHSRYQCLDRPYQTVFLVFFFLVHFPNFRSIFLLQIKLFNLSCLIFFHTETSSFLFWQQGVPWWIAFNCRVEISSWLLSYVSTFFISFTYYMRKKMTKCNDLSDLNWAHNSV